MSTPVEDFIDTDVDSVATGLSTMTFLDRRELLQLGKWKDELMQNIAFLSSTKKYISRQDRALLSRFINIYERRYRKDCSIELHELRKSTQTHLTDETRQHIRELLEELLTRFAPDLDNLVYSDSERFASIVDGAKLFEKEWKFLRSIGVVLCHVLPRVQKIELYGTKPEDQFYEDVKNHWKFVHPEQYFLYTGGASVPVGITESGTHLIAGSTLDSDSAVLLRAAV